MNERLFIRHAFPAPVPVESVVEPTIGVVIVDLPCRKCGYNVRGLPPGGICPECGTRVAMSLQEELLRFCDPTWVRTLHRGVRWILLSIVLIGLGVIAGIGLEIAGRSRLSEISFQVMMLVGSAIGFIGSWWLTEPDPSGLGEDRYGAARKLIRVTLLLGVIETVLGLATDFGATLPPWARMTTQVVTLVLQIAGLIGLLATLQYLRRLSLRIPDPAIARRSHFLTYALGSTYGIVVLVVAVADLLAGQAATTSMALGCVMVPVGLALIVFAIMSLMMTIKLGRRLAEQAAIAKRSWHEPTPFPTPPAPASA